MNCLSLLVQPIKNIIYELVLIFRKVIYFSISFNAEFVLFQLISMPCLFQQIGGHDQLQKMVAQFYQFVLSDQRINYFFLQYVSDIPKLHSTMVQFLTFLFGGPNHYKGPNMVDLHINMPLKQIHFDITWQHMQSAFLVFKLSKDLIKELKQAVYSTQRDIVQNK